MRRDVAQGLALLKSADAGTLDGLLCPKCGAASVSVRFTNPFDGQYRTWFVCGSCDFRMRAQDSGKPRHFSPDRVDAALERHDRR
jgi:hypothetical protein